MRPEDFLPAETGLKARVSVIEPTGSETHVVLRTEQGPEAVSVLRDRRAIAAGEDLHLWAAPDRVHLFDAESGARLGV